MNRRRGRLRLISIPNGYRLFGPSRLFRCLTWLSFLFGTALFAVAVAIWRDSNSAGWLGFDAASVILGAIGLYHWSLSVYYFANGPDRMLGEINQKRVKLDRCRTFAAENVQAVLIDDFGDIASMLGFRIDGKEIFLGELTAVEDVGDVAGRIAELLDVPVLRRQQVV
ncbi:MAG: hypothetical protein KF784_12675 [Fimbriimonadaceae bacterium]|nr:hypothetical protein [Fimbriimonadaceae bacterium]